MRGTSLAGARRAALCASLVVATVAGAREAAPGARDEDANGHARLATRLDTLAREFAAVGFELEGGAPALAAQTAADWPAAFARAAPALRVVEDSPAAWLLSGVRDVRAARAAAAAELAASVRLRYDAGAQRLLVLETAQADLVADERTLAHELARAWLEQRFGLARRLALPTDAAPTLEHAQRCAELEEGLADAVALEVLLARGQRTLADLPPQKVEDALARLAAAPGPLARFTAGRRSAVEGLRAEGRAFLERACDEPPLSTSALLHAAQRARPAPPPVELVDWPDAWEPLPLVVDDVVGEQGLYDALLGAGIARPAAWRAAVGWDGDRIRAWANERETLWAWRIVCDREVDAVQLVSAWTRFGCRVRRNGRAFVCVLGSDAGHVDELLERLAELPLAAADLDTGARTQAIEDAQPALSPEARVEGGRWVVPSHGLSFPAPAGWRAQTMSGTPFLFAPRRSGSFIDNLNAQSFEDPSGGDLERIKAENRAGLQALPGLRLSVCETVELAELGQRAVWIRYAANQGGNEVEFAALVIPRAGRMIVLTASLLAEGADESLPGIERTLLGVREL